MAEGMFAGFMRARQAQANLDQTEAQTAGIQAQAQAAQVKAANQAALSGAVRQMMGVEPLPPTQAPIAEAPAVDTTTGAQRQPQVPDAGQQLARAAGLPNNLAVKESSYGQSRAEQQAEFLSNMGRLHILAGEYNVGRQYIDSSVRAEKAAADLEEKNLKINARQADAMGSLASTVYDQGSLDRAILAAQVQGYDPQQLMDITGGGQWNAETKQALEQYSRAALTVKEQSSLELDAMAEERFARNTESMIEDRHVRQSISRENLAISREGLQLRRETAAKKRLGGGAGRVGGMTFNERKSLFNLENKVPDPFEMRELKKHNPAAYEEAVQRTKGIETDFNRWHIRTFGVTPQGQEPAAPVERGAPVAEETGPVDFEGLSDEGLDELVKTSSKRSVGIPKAAIDAEAKKRAEAKKPAAEKPAAEKPAAEKPAAAGMPEAKVKALLNQGWTMDQIKRAYERKKAGK